MDRHINREKNVHGKRWNSVHEGYFSDPAIAMPLIRKVRKFVRTSKPDTIVDLGGGTGFLLTRLRAAGVAPGITLVNLDASPTQLDAARTSGFARFKGSVDSFSRRDIGSDVARYFYMMRSVLHYFGKDGLCPVLRHVRAQTEPGEYFVHQTASFSRRQDADCLNELYAMMETEKWYPTVAFLRKSLCAEGWNVLEVCRAAPLRLKSEDLMQRYHLDQKDICRIRDRLLRKTGVPADVVTITAGGFCAFLHYWTYVCTPAMPGTVCGAR